MDVPAKDPAAPENSASSPGNPASQNSIWALIDNPWVVLILLFFVMGVLGVPVLWKSRGFSTLWKLVLSVVVTLYTALLFWLVWLIIVWSYTRIVDAFR